MLSYPNQHQLLLCSQLKYEYSFYLSCVNTLRVIQVGSTALMVAAQQGHVRTVNALLEGGAYIEATEPVLQ